MTKQLVLDDPDDNAAAGRLRLEAEVPRDLAEAPKEIRDLAVFLASACGWTRARLRKALGRARP